MTHRKNTSEGLIAALASWEQFIDVFDKNENMCNVFYKKEDVLRHTPTTFVFSCSVPLFATLYAEIMSTS